MSKLLERRAKFRSMSEGTPEEWHVVSAHAIAHHQGNVGRVVEHLALLEAEHGGYAVDRLEHSLQTASRAHLDGRDDEYVVCALLHDIGDTLGSFNHADIAAAVLKPFISEQNRWMVEHHAIFQGYYFFEHVGLDKNMRDEFRDHPFFDYTAEFCELYDQVSFDPDYESMPLDAFLPIVDRVMRKPKSSIYVP